MYNLPKSVKNVMMPTVNEEGVRKALIRQATFNSSASKEQMPRVIRRTRSSENMQNAIGPPHP